FQRSAPVRIGSIRDVDHVFTDLPLPSALAEACATWDTHVHVCPPGD
ncbi:MAG TPA: DeoR family transcriptional regulator, partial [Roseovarius sp.]|nr:DeoR family transcriptional regulator [Roseovarius sp.]